MGSDENKLLGYIKDYRSKLEWRWFTYPATAHLFEYCKLKANFADKNVGGIIVKRGSFMTSLEKLSENTGLTKQQVRTALKNLISTQEITKETTQKYTIIKVNNYDLYQGVTQFSTNEQQTDNKRTTTNKKEKKEINKEVVVDNIDYTADFLDFWDVYKRKRYMADTFEYWQKMDITPELKKEIIYGAKRYCESEKDLRSLVFPRTFLENRIWRDYPEPKDEDDLSYYLRSKGY